MEKDKEQKDVSVCACFETAIRAGCIISFLISKHQSSIIRALLEGDPKRVIFLK